MSSALLLLATAAPESHEPQLIDLDGTAFIQLGLFLLLMLVLRQFLWRPYLKVLGERTTRVDGYKQEAVRLDAEAASRLAKAEAALAEARRVGSGERVEARAIAQKREQELLAAANASAQKTLAEARARVGGVGRRARQAAADGRRHRRAGGAQDPGPRGVGVRALVHRWRRRLRRLGRLPAAVGFAAFVALVALAPASARADEEAAHEGGAEAEPAPKLDTGKLALQLLNFAVLAGIIGWFGGKAINKALLARHQQLKADLVAAAEARSAAEGRAVVQQKRLETLETEIADMRAGIKQEAEDEKQRLIAAAEARAKSITEETTFLLDQQVKEAEITLRREVAEAAVKIAEQLVTRSMNAGDQQRLVDTFVSDVAAPATTPTGRTA